MQNFQTKLFYTINMFDDTEYAIPQLVPESFEKTTNKRSQDFLILLLLS